MENQLRDLKSQVRQVKITLWLIIGSAILIIAVGATLLVPDIFKVEYNGTTRMSVTEKGEMRIDADASASNPALKFGTVPSTVGDLGLYTRASDPTAPQEGQVWYNSADKRMKIRLGDFKYYTYLALTQRVNDGTTNANHGTRGTNATDVGDASDPIWTADGKLGGCALSFDGTDDVVYASGTSLDVTANFTVEGWIKTGAASAVAVVANRDWLTANNSTGGWNMTVNGGGNGTLSFIYGNTSNYGVFTTTVTVNDNVWHHVAASVSATTVTLFVDGAQVGSPHTMTTSPTIAFNPNHQFLIGANKINNVPAGFFPGSIDEVAVWNAALTPAQVAARYNGGAGMELAGNESGLVSVWHMNDPK